MNLKVIRDKKLDKSTMGEFLIDDVFACYSMELPWNNGSNTKDKSCILPGKYEVIIDFSPHHNQDWPHILNVPGRDNVRIDIANWPSQILGCIAVGLNRGDNFLGQSKMAWLDLFSKLKEALSKEKVFIETINKFEGD